MLRALFHLASEAKATLPLLWLYPRDLPALAHMSFDSDNNEPERAKRLLEILREADIHTTWCITLPGYEPELLAKIRDAGHELATHYDALDNPGTEWEVPVGKWSEESLDDAGVKNRLVIVPHGGHGWGNMDNEGEQLIDWFDATL